MRLAYVLTLIVLLFIGCGVAEQPPIASDASRSEIKTVSVAIGMPVEELARQPSVVSLDGSDISTAMYFGISEAVDLEIEIGTKKLNLPNVGGIGFETTFSFEDGLLRDTSISPASRIMSLAEALTLATDLAMWFEGAGLVASDKTFGASRRKRDSVLPEISTAAEAEAALRDERLMIASMAYYWGVNGDLEAIVRVYSPPRMRALAGDTRVAADTDVWLVSLDLERIR